MGMGENHKVENKQVRVVKRPNKANSLCRAKLGASEFPGKG